MNVLIKNILGRIGDFFRRPYCRRLVYLVILFVVSVLEFANAGLTRRTFVFYGLEDGEERVEYRMLRRDSSEEEEIRRYVEEVLLGPAAQDSAPLFPRDTQLRSLLYRDRVVYVDLSPSAALPVGGQGVFENLAVLNRGIRRNFPPVRDVKVFIEGNEAYPEKFKEMFSKSGLQTDKIVPGM
jgi:hypothetical protein